MDVYRSRRALARSGASLTLAVLGLGLWLLPGRALAQDDAPPPVPNEEQPEALTTGPVHEGFAQPVNLQDQGGVIAPSQPPEPIEETPSSDKPAGSQFVWVPGYWSWDTQRNSWVWVSACWRAAPPNMAWVPGYWSQVSDGWQWVPGFWTPATQQDVEYLPAPPAPFEVDAPGAPPAWDYTWVPGCWYWQGGRYVARHGYWAQQHHGWLWTPAHLEYTPRGYVFCQGYWDLSLERRGVLFAPVLLSRAQYSRRGFVFQPSIVIDLGAVVANLFVCPRYSHYYFGDYYDTSFERAGIYPRGHQGMAHTFYDPIYVHATWFHHNDLSGWHAREEERIRERRTQVDLRPAHTYREQQVRLARMPDAQRAAANLGRPLNQVVRQPNQRFQYEQTTAETRRRVAEQTTAQRTFRNDRARWETPSGHVSGPAPGGEHHTEAGRPRSVDRSEPVTVRIPSPPVASRKPEPNAKTPPERPGSETHGRHSDQGSDKGGDHGSKGGGGDRGGDHGSKGTSGDHGGDHGSKGSGGDRGGDHGGQGGGGDHGGDHGGQGGGDHGRH